MYLIEQLYLDDKDEVVSHPYSFAENMKEVDLKIKELKENFKKYGLEVYRLIATKDNKYLKVFLNNNIVVRNKEL